MALTPQVSSDTFGFVLQNFDAAYEQKVVLVQQLAGAIVDEWPTVRPTETYSYLETAPYMARWNVGDSRSASAFRGVKWSVDTYDYQSKVTWHRNTDQDHQGRRNIKSKSMMTARNAANTKIRLMSQTVEGRSDPDLLPDFAIPTAPDGAAPFAAQAEGTARFGAIGGNIVAQTGTTGQMIRDDYFTSITRFLSFLDTEGKPLWDPDMIREGFTIMYPKELIKGMAEAFQWARPTHSDDPTFAAPTVATAPTNLAQDFNVSVNAFMNPYLTDASKWYIFLNGTLGILPFFLGVQQPLQFDIWDRANSDRARDEKLEGVGVDARYSFGCGPMYGSIQVAA